MAIRKAKNTAILQPIETKAVQVLEIPNSADWLGDSGFDRKIDDLHQKYNIKSMTITRDRNVIVEIYKD